MPKGKGYKKSGAKKSTSKRTKTALVSPAAMGGAPKAKKKTKRA